MTQLPAQHVDVETALDEAAIDLEAIGPVTLPDGRELTAQQNVAATLAAITDLSNAQIAKLAGYSDRSAVYRFLHSDLGEYGVRARLTSHLVRAGKIGLMQTIRLARTAKSENVRQMAAAKLIDVARLEPAVDASSPTTGAGQREVKISINVGQAAQPKDVTPESVTIEHE